LKAFLINFSKLSRFLFAAIQVRLMKRFERYMAFRILQNAEPFLGRRLFQWLPVLRRVPYENDRLRTLSPGVYGN
jgi:hypothetical protein